MAEGEKRAERKDSFAECDVSALRRFLAEEKAVMLYVRREDPSGMTDYFENGPLPEYFQGCKGTCAHGMVGVDGKDPECGSILDELKIDSTPTVIAFKDGVEVERMSPSGDKDGDLSRLKKMEEKIGE